MITMFSGNQNIELKFWKFPGGERNVKIVSPSDIIRFRSFTLTMAFKGSDDLIDLLLLVNAIRNVDAYTRLRLVVPYFPAARQDRVMTEGEPLAVQVFAQLIESCGFYEVEVWDPHSDVVAALFPPGKLKVVPQWQLWQPVLESTFKNHGMDAKPALLSPDAGALKKIYKLAKLVDMPVVEAKKVRDVSTGNITKTEVDSQALSRYNIIFVVDDICDGGRTFEELAKVIREGGYTGKLVLCVTHGIFSKGLDCLSEYDAIYSINNMSVENLNLFNFSKKV